VIVASSVVTAGAVYGEYIAISYFIPGLGVIVGVGLITQAGITSYEESWKAQAIQDEAKWMNKEHEICRAICTGSKA